MCANGDVIFELDSLIGFCYDGVWYRNDGLLDSTTTQSTGEGERGSQLSNSSIFQLTTAVLGALIGLMSVILILMAISICVCIVVNRRRHKKSEDKTDTDDIILKE